MRYLLAALMLGLGLGLGVSTSASAQQPTLKVGETLHGRFIQERHLQGFAHPVRSEGSYVLVPGRGLIWYASRPFAVTTVVTPAGLVQNVGGTETTRLPAARLPFLTRLYHMMEGAMAGDWSGLEAEFVVTREGEGTLSRVILTPRVGDDGTAATIRSIEARVGRYVDAVDIIKPGGDRDHLEFSEQVLSRGAPTAEEAALLATAGLGTTRR